MAEQKHKLAIPIPSADDGSELSLTVTTSNSNAATASVHQAPKPLADLPKAGTPAMESPAIPQPSVVSVRAKAPDPAQAKVASSQDHVPPSAQAEAPADQATPATETAKSWFTRPLSLISPLSQKSTDATPPPADNTGKIVEKLVDVGIGALGAFLKRRQEQEAAQARIEAQRQENERRRAEVARHEQEQKQKAAADAVLKAMAESAAHSRRATDDLQRRNATARIQRGWLEHRVVEGGIRGIKIHLQFTITGMQGTQGMVAAFLQYADGAPVKNKNDKFGTKDGQVAVWTTLTPGFPISNYENITLFIPSEEFHLSVRRIELRWLVRVLTAPGGRNLAEIMLPCVWTEG